MKFATIKEGPNAGEFVPTFLVPMSSVKYKMMRHHELGLSWTASGYGSKIPTQYMVRTSGNRWRRVYCRIYSNIGTLYVVEKGLAYRVDFNN